MADTQSILDSHNRLCLAISSALSSTGDPSQLLVLKHEVEEVLRLMSGNQAQGLATHEIQAMQQNCASMVEAIDSVVSTQVIEYDLQCSPVTVSDQAHTGKRGRPAVEVNPVAFEQLLELRGPKSTGQLLGCSYRTVRRRALELGLARPGPPVFTHETQPDGNVLKVFHRPESVHNTDEEVCTAVSAVLEIYPDMGREKMVAAVKARGVSTTRRQVEAALLTLRGPPDSGKRRPIQRRVYTVPGSNYLWHHDGQHGLIRWKLIIHAFIDGHARFVVGIQVNPNNRAATVLDLFLRATAEHGMPYHIRGDHGVENVLVANYIEDVRGPGGYIWGRSVHNTRIERLWVEVTRDFGSKWKEFFYELEAECGLDPDAPGHIWLLHYLFLDAINEDAYQWAAMWNEHKLQIKGGRKRSPREIFLTSLLQDGPRGVYSGVASPTVSEQGSSMDYPVPENPLLTRPPSLSQVDVEVPGCPLNDDELQEFDGWLGTHVDVGNRCMLYRKSIWIDALDFCSMLRDNDSA